MRLYGAPMFVNKIDGFIDRNVTKKRLRIEGGKEEIRRDLDSF